MLRQRAFERHDPCRLREMPGVGVLLEPDGLSLAQVPDVRDLRVDRLAGRLRRPLVACLDQDRVAGGDDAADVDAEAVDIWAMRASTPAGTACGPMNAPPGQ